MLVVVTVDKVLPVHWAWFSGAMGFTAVLKGGGLTTILWLGEMRFRASKQLAQGCIRSCRAGLKVKVAWGAWVAPSVKHPTLDFGLGPDLMVHEFRPRIRLHTESTQLSLPLSLCSSPLVLSCSLSLSLTLNINI